MKPDRERRGLASGFRAAISMGATLMVMSAAPALADDFSPTEGFTASGAPTWKFEVGPIGWLPKTRINAGLGDLPVHSATIPVGNILSNLTGAFMGDGYLRYGNLSGELNLFWVSLGKNQLYPLPGPVPGTVNVRLHAAIGSISPGVGYRLIASDSHKVSLVARVGFTYAWLNANARVQDSPGGVGTSSSFVQPWIGERLAYFPSPKWRILNTLAVTGLGVDGGRVGWNGALGVSYLVNRGLDVSLGYRAAQSFSSRPAGPQGQNLDVDILDYGPVLGAGFRF